PASSHVVSITGLTLREETYIKFLELQNQSLNPDEETRYLNPEETLRTMREAIETNASEVRLRVRYFPQNYVVEAGDTASKIARKTGIPFYLIEQHNPGRDLNVLSVGDTLNMPTRDVTMPNAPVAEKRIVVNLEEQELWAYENDQLVFNWTISSGRSNAPTSPGIYQILNHDEVAYGSSFSLCDDGTCGQWEMYWFMGMYEVVPGLMNGFHGAVLLPNGAYLNGGDVGYPSTFGCVMSTDDLARELFEWAEVGTVVEIISDEFEPLSDRAQQTLQSA
ncbi:MAG: L,D-transpeptidase family protein, partial [Chloroflexota bacterium]